MQFSIQETRICKAKPYDVIRWFTDWQNYKGLFGPNKEIRTYAIEGLLYIEIDSVFLWKKTTEEFKIVIANNPYGNWSIRINKISVSGAYGSWDVLEVIPITKKDTKIIFTMGSNVPNGWMQWLSWLIIPLVKYKIRSGLEKALKKIEQL